MEDGGRKKEKRAKALLWCLAAAVFGGGVFLWVLLSDPVAGYTPSGVLMGDSIYAERSYKAITEMVEERTGLELQNASLGGTSLSRSDQERWMDLTVDNLSMIALSKAILAQDFSVQRQAGIRSPATEYFDGTIEEMAGWDFSKVRTLLLAYGMNDYQNGVPLEIPEKPESEYSFTGALRRILTDLRSTYPQLRLILLTPTYSWYLKQGQSCEERDWGGGYLEEYVEREKELAGEFGVEVLDLYHGLYQHEEFEDWKLVTVDGVHPNEKGREMIADRIAAYLEEHP